jgi:hypothetical protein
MGSGWALDGLRMGSRWALDGLWMGSGWGSGWVLDGLWMGSGWSLDGLTGGLTYSQELHLRAIHYNSYYHTSHNCISHRDVIVVFPCLYVVVLVSLGLKKNIALFAFIAYHKTAPVSLCMKSES